MEHPLFALLARLDLARYHYTLERKRPETVTVNISFVGERVEVDVFDDGHMEVARFRGTEAIEGGSELIFKLISDYEVLDGTS